MIIKNKYVMPSQENLLQLITKCRLSPEEAQLLLNDYFFDFAKSIIADYCIDPAEQLEVINQGFRKVCKYIHHFNMDSRNLSDNFKDWIRKMMIHAAVGHCRNNFKLSCFLNLDCLEMRSRIKSSVNNGRFSSNNIKAAISQLPASSKIVLNLTTIHGFSEQELAQCLGVSIEIAHSLLFEATRKFNELLLADKQKNSMPGSTIIGEIGCNN